MAGVEGFGVHGGDPGWQGKLAPDQGRLSARQRWDFILLAMGSNQRLLSPSVACCDLRSEVSQCGAEEEGREEGKEDGVCSVERGEPAAVAIVSGINDQGLQLNQEHRK